MKTGAYWFKFLTDKEQEEFKLNCRLDGRFDYVMEKEIDHFKRFLMLVFPWGATLQGFKYWHEISQRKTD